jgi:hypothetical protein
MEWDGVGWSGIEWDRVGRSEIVSGMKWDWEWKRVELGVENCGIGTGREWEWDGVG